MARLIPLAVSHAHPFLNDAEIRVKNTFLDFEASDSYRSSLRLIKSSPELFFTSTHDVGRKCRIDSFDSTAGASTEDKSDAFTTSSEAELQKTSQAEELDETYEFLELTTLPSLPADSDPEIGSTDGTHVHAVMQFHSSGSAALLAMKQLHDSGRCTPCSYFATKSDSCRFGDACSYCHFETKEELKEKKRIQKRLARKIKRGCKPSVWSPA
jgi:hypothetical protein